MRSRRIASTCRSRAFAACSRRAISSSVRARASSSGPASIAPARALEIAFAQPLRRGPRRSTAVDRRPRQHEGGGDPGAHAVEQQDTERRRRRDGSRTCARPRTARFAKRHAGRDQRQRHEALAERRAPQERPRHDRGEDRHQRRHGIRESRRSVEARRVSIPMTAPTTSVPAAPARRPPPRAASGASRPSWLEPVAHAPDGHQALGVRTDRPRSSPGAGGCARSRWRLSPSHAKSHTSSSSCVRLNVMPGLATPGTRRRSNSLRVRRTGTPAIRSSRRPRSICEVAERRAGRRTVPRFGPAKDRAHPRASPPAARTAWSRSRRRPCPSPRSDRSPRRAR